jgi:hypothetical protein
MEFKFCNKCHRRISPPGFLINGKAKITGNIIVKCPYCKNGKVQFNQKKEVEVVSEESGSPQIDRKDNGVSDIRDDASKLQERGEVPPST